MEMGHITNVTAKISFTLSHLLTVYSCRRLPVSADNLPTNTNKSKAHQYVSYYKSVYLLDKNNLKPLVHVECPKSKCFTFF